MHHCYIIKKLELIRKYLYIYIYVYCINDIDNIVVVIFVSILQYLAYSY